ncbi:LLM class flavin-dependent oxidoreductase [Amycolatopsis cynarae]|uniref:LLM class flavin-dependent oxidoreductase n=1 Tax=Amycolatopsis cynarae TaxID=2995223 RepID=A0ABY7B233_9PSEU|nr:LLM class flavin-dependent oxidoreductase [Amycolatopsis sp. HUAS 11-8]WAL66364.1 LLM class flavin-dependent oxidoreductase [Amycolatopsis sp. HUAS 11-8]
MTERPFRFGIVGTAIDLAGWTGLARRAEDAGYDVLLSPDPQPAGDPFTLLSAAAAVTTTLHMGTFVAVERFRNRELLAWQASSLHGFTGGRFELGLGSGRPDLEGHAAKLGVSYGTRAERVAHLADTLTYLREQPDRPPLLVAAGGPKALEVAARTADILALAWLPGTTEPEAKAVVDHFRRVCDRLDEIELSLNIMAVGDGPAPWLERFAGVTAEELVRRGAVTVLPGTHQEQADTLLRRRDEYGTSYITVNGSFVDEFAPVIELLKGR